MNLIFSVQVGPSRKPRSVGSNKKFSMSTPSSNENIDLSTHASTTEQFDSLLYSDDNSGLVGDKNGIQYLKISDDSSEASRHLGVSELLPYSALLNRGRRESLNSEADALSCGASNCSRMVCYIKNLRATESIVVRVQSRLWVDTIENVSWDSW